MHCKYLVDVYDQHKSLLGFETRNQVQVLILFHFLMGTYKMSIYNFRLTQPFVSRLKNNVQTGTVMIILVWCFSLVICLPSFLHAASSNPVRNQLYIIFTVYVPWKIKWSVLPKYLQ